MTASPDRDAQDSGATDKPSGLMGIVKVILGNGSYVALGFLANVVSANSLTPAEFGLVSIALATLNVLQEISGNGLDLAMVRLAAPHVEREPSVAASYFRAALQLKLLVNGAIALLLFACAPLLAQGVFDNPDMAPMLRWVSAGLIGAALYNYMLARVQAEEEFTLYAILRASNNVAKLLVLALIWLLGTFTPDSVMGAWMSAFFIGYVLAVAFGETRKFRREPHTPVLQPEYWRRMFDFSKWVIASSFLFSLYSRTDMLILARFANTEAIGQYAAAWNITFIIDLLTYSVIIALLPRASKIHHRDEFAPYLRSTFMVCAVLALLLLPAFFLSDWFFSVFFPAYTASSDLFRVLFIGAIITLLFHPLYLILYARNRVNRLTLINFLLFIGCAVGGLLVIPYYGAPGAAWVTVSGRVFAAALICYFVHVELQTVFAEHRADRDGQGA
jgi:O-antigen/teichoic acid export membrane protein